MIINNKNVGNKITVKYIIYSYYSQSNKILQLPYAVFCVEVHIQLS